MNPILSILTPTIPSRLTQQDEYDFSIKTAAWLQTRIAAQIGNLPVEHLMLCDNRARSIGAKRQALADIARGEYIAFVDDDDDISEGYVAALLAAAESKPDVITFRQRAIYNGLESEVHFRLGQGDGPFTPGGITKRDAWHVCAWRREKVIGCLFGESNFGEDVVWCRQARKRVRTEIHIPEVLHTYRHDAATTAAPEPV